MNTSKLMKWNLFILGIFLAPQVNSQSYQKIHRKAILADTHNDILSQVVDKGYVFDEDLSGKTHSDLARMKQGGVDVQFFSVWSDGNQVMPFDFAIRQIDSLNAVIKRNPGKIVKVSNSAELLKAVREDKIAALIGVEGGHQMEDDLGKLEELYRQGVRYMTLTWNNSTSWASSAFDETFSKDLKHKGLNDFGKQVVQRMNTLGMMIDISHVGEISLKDVLSITTKPVIASHSSVHHFCAHQRNLKDDQIKAIARNGGVIQVNFYSGFLDSTYQIKKAAFIEKHKAETDSLLGSGKSDWLVESYLFNKYADEVRSMRPPLSLLIQHIEYIVQLAGIDHVGLGSDFDGIESAPLQLDDVSTYPVITKALREKGYSRKDIQKILGGNLLRVFRANEAK